MYRVWAYDTAMLKTFAHRDTEALYGGTRVRCFMNTEPPARRKLQFLKAAMVLEDLQTSPGNQLEAR